MNENKIICETCGSSDISIKDNYCICNTCGNKFVHKVLDSDADKIPFYLHEAETEIGDQEYEKAEKSIMQVLTLDNKNSLAWGFRGLCVSKKIKSYNYTMLVDDLIDYFSKSIQYSHEKEKTQADIVAVTNTIFYGYLIGFAGVLEAISYYLDIPKSVFEEKHQEELYDIVQAGITPVLSVLSDIDNDVNGDKPIEEKYGCKVFEVKNEEINKISEIIMRVYDNQIFNGYLNVTNNKVNWGKFLNNSMTIKKILYLINALLKDDEVGNKNRLLKILKINKNLLKSTYIDADGFKCNDVTDEKTEEIIQENKKIETN